MSADRTDRYNAVVDAVLRQTEGDLEIAAAASRARELESIEQGMVLQGLDDDQLSLFGWTRTELNVAVDAKRSGQSAPTYLKFVHERMVTRMRVANDAGGGNRGATGYVLPTPMDRRQIGPVIDAEPVDE